MFSHKAFQKIMLSLNPANSITSPDYFRVMLTRRIVADVQDSPELLMNNLIANLNVFTVLIVERAIMQGLLMPSLHVAERTREAYRRYNPEVHSQPMDVYNGSVVKPVFFPEYAEALKNSADDANDAAPLSLETIRSMHAFDPFKVVIDTGEIQEAHIILRLAFPDIYSRYYADSGNYHFDFDPHSQFMAMIANFKNSPFPLIPLPKDTHNPDGSRTAVLNFIRDCKSEHRQALCDMDHEMQLMQGENDRLMRKHNADLYQSNEQAIEKLKQEAEAQIQAIRAKRDKRIRSIRQTEKAAIARYAEQLDFTPTQAAAKVKTHKDCKNYLLKLQRIRKALKP